MFESGDGAGCLSGLAWCVYFLGPAAVWLVICGGQARSSLRIFLLGVATFLSAWVVIAQLLGLLSAASLIGQVSSLSYTLAFAASAALFEETFRLGALRLVQRMVAAIDRRAVLAYAAGHAGGESLLRGWTRIEAGQLSGADLLADAAYHVAGALVVQACFTLLVYRSLRGRTPWFFLLAMLLHFVQDMPWAAALGSSGEALQPLVVLGFYPVLVAWLLVDFRASRESTIAAEPIRRALA
jgi:uncharacterized membrane protein YhfC